MMKGWRRFGGAKIRGVAFILLFLLGLTAAHSGIIEVGAVGIEGRMGEKTITLEFMEPVHYRSFTLNNPPRLVLDIPGVTLKEPRTVEIKNEVVESISYEQYRPDTVRIVVNLTQSAESRVRKAGKNLLLSFTLPREVRARLETERRAKAKAEEAMRAKLTAEEKVRIEREREEAERLARVRRAELKEKKEEQKRLEAERSARKKEEEERKRAEEKARQLLDRGLRRETELKARKAVSEKRLAEETARREEKKRKRDIGNYLSRGETDYRDKRFDEALKEFEAVLALEPGNKEAQTYLTLTKEAKQAWLLAKIKAAQEEKERQEEEQKQLEDKRREQKQEREIAEYLNRGKKYYLQGRYTEAISEGEKVLSVSPGNSRAEALIVQSKRRAMDVEKKKVQAEKDIVEQRRTLDVSRAVYVSPVDYANSINPEKGMLAGGEPAATQKKGKEKAAVAKLKETAEKTKVKLNFKNTNLYDVILFLSKMSNVNIFIDQKALDGLDNPNVNLYTPTPISLTDALDLILKVKGLDYVIKKNYIWIAKKGEEEDAVTKTYRLKYGIRKIREVTLTTSAAGE